MNCRMVLLSAMMLVLAVTCHAQNKRDIAVREDRQQLAGDDSWFYDDLEMGFDAAAKTMRPLMIVFR